MKATISVLHVYSCKFCLKKFSLVLMIVLQREAICTILLKISSTRCFFNTNIAGHGDFFSFCVSMLGYMGCRSLSSLGSLQSTVGYSSEVITPPPTQY